MFHDFYEMVLFKIFDHGNQKLTRNFDLFKEELKVLFLSILLHCGHPTLLQ